jgi:hypothetical protein
MHPPTHKYYTHTLSGTEQSNRPEVISDGYQDGVILVEVRLVSELLVQVLRELLHIALRDGLGLGAGDISGHLPVHMIIMLDKVDH